MQHTAGEARVRLEWAGRTNLDSSSSSNRGLSVVPAANLFHHRPGWKVVVDLHPAPTAAGASTVVVRPTPSDDEDEVEEEGNEEEEVWTGGNVGMPTEVTAGKTMEVVVQARDVYGNHRGIGAWFWYRGVERGGREYFSKCQVATIKEYMVNQSKREATYMENFVAPRRTSNRYRSS